VGWGWFNLLWPLICLFAMEAFGIYYAGQMLFKR
jgi:hypothetical protein